MTITRLLPGQLTAPANRWVLLASATLAVVAFSEDATHPQSYSIEGKVTVEVEAPEATPDAARAPAAVVTGNQIRTLEPVYFESGGEAVRPQSFPTLDAVASVIVATPAMRVQVDAHTDSMASRDNVALSQRRAEWVRSWLIKRGVAPERLTARGFGSTRPVATNDTQVGRQLNRRVEFVILP